MTPINPKDFLVLTAANRRQFSATGMGGEYPNHDLAPILKVGCRGYTGWGHSHIFKGPAPVTTLIPRGEWPAMIAAGAGTEGYTAMLAAGLKAKNQQSLNYCWVFASTRTVEIRRLLEGLPHIELSPESVGGPATNWRNVGGDASEAFDQLQTGGACEASYLDKPCSLKYARWKTGWQANAKTHENIDWWNIVEGTANAFDLTFTCLLQGSPVSLGIDWWGHELAGIAPVMLTPPPNPTFGILFQNSWGQDWPTAGANGFAIFDEASGTPDGAASPTLTIDAPVPPPTVSAAIVDRPLQDIDALVQAIATNGLDTTGSATTPVVT